MTRARTARWQALAVIPPAGTPAASRIAAFRREHVMQAALAERRDCPWCPAVAGELCRTGRGGVAFYHYGRLWPGGPD